jgi:ribosomal-protein-alanine N-acetyltransferase
LEEKQMFHFRQAEPDDINAISQLFLASFPESIRHIFGSRQPPVKAIADIFTFILKFEPSCFWSAIYNGEIVGYVIAPKNMRRLWLAALTGGHIFRWLYYWLTGKHQIGLKSLQIIITNKLTFIFSPYNYRSTPPAQILSIAVAKKVAGQGIGKKLMSHALAYLTSQGVQEVKLEVRPHNTPARRLYSKLGFLPVGTTKDSQGEWLVLVKKLSPNTHLLTPQ